MKTGRNKANWKVPSFSQKRDRLTKTKIFIYIYITEGKILLATFIAFFFDVVKQQNFSTPTAHS